MNDSANQLLNSLSIASVENKVKIIKELETILLNIDDKQLAETILTDLYQLMLTSTEYANSHSSYISITQVILEVFYSLKHKGIKFLALTIVESERQFYIPEKCYDQGFYIGDYASELIIPKEFAKRYLFWLFRDFAKAVDLRPVEILVQEISTITNIEKRAHLISTLKTIKGFYKKEHLSEFDKLAGDLLNSKQLAFDKV